MLHFEKFKPDLNKQLHSQNYFNANAKASKKNLC